MMLLSSRYYGSRFDNIHNLNLTNDTDRVADYSPLVVSLLMCVLYCVITVAIVTAERTI